MSILQDFFHGEILTWEQFNCSDDPTYKMFTNNITILDKSLTECLTEKEQKMYEEIRHLWIGQENIKMEQMFLYAFKMGAFFMLDLFSE